MAKILETPNKLASIGNSYSIYKAYGDINMPTFLKKKQERNQKIEEKLIEVERKIIEEQIAEQNAERKAAKDKLAQKERLM